MAGRGYNLWGTVKAGVENKATEVTGADYEAEALQFILQEVRRHQGFVKGNDA